MSEYKIDWGCWSCVLCANCEDPGVIQFSVEDGRFMHIDYSTMRAFAKVVAAAATEAEELARDLKG